MAHTQHMINAAPDASLALEAKNRRLQTLVGELLVTNQELRFKVAELEKQSKSLEHGLAVTAAAAGALWP